MQLMTNALLAQAGVTETVQTSTSPFAHPLANAALYDVISLRDKYYASETDILLATRRALYDEIVIFKPVIAGREFQTLANFIDMLRKVSDRID
jgi:hypothetical protein